MAYRNGNYSAFYVKEPFNENNLGAHSTKDFVSYNLLRAWKGADSSFPFIDSHNKNYNVRDGSDWEKTLKPRIRERISNSKNLILFLSSITKTLGPSGKRLITASILMTSQLLLSILNTEKSRISSTAHQRR